jgi:hypothetical protein
LGVGKTLRNRAEALFRGYSNPALLWLPRVKKTLSPFVNNVTMKKVLLVALILSLIKTANAQSAGDSVKAIINQLFAAMKNGDASLLKGTFADSAILQTITPQGQIRTDDVGAFVKQVAFLPKGDADERISFDVVKVDGGLAIAWTPYKFYYKGAFSHCGVNSFQLVRMNGRWKIQYLIDTRQKENCE